MNLGLDVLTWVVLLVMLAPVLWLLISAFQDDLELSTGAYDLLHPTFDAFTGMWDTIDFERFFLNSLIICTCGGAARDRVRAARPATRSRASSSAARAGCR